MAAASSLNKALFIKDDPWSSLSLNVVGNPLVANNGGNLDSLLMFCFFSLNSATGDGGTCREVGLEGLVILIAVMAEAGL